MYMYYKAKTSRNKCSLIKLEQNELENRKMSFKFLEKSTLPYKRIKRGIFSKITVLASKNQQFGGQSSQNGAK